MIFFLRFLQFLSPYLLINFAIEKFINLPEKLNRNLISAIHCYLNILLTIGSIVFNSNLIYLLAVFNSIGYFIYDLILIYRKELKEYGYIVHHFISLGFLGYILMLDNKMSFSFFLLLTIGELSNILIYPIYHLIQTNYQGEILERLKWWQALTYTLFRIYGFPIYTFLAGIEHNFIIYCLMVIYLMSYFWSYKILSKLRV